MPVTRRDALVAPLVFALPRQAWAEVASPRVLEARAAHVRLAGEPGTETPILGYDGATPGPLLRMKAGEEMRVDFVNRLDQPTAIHWQGVRIRNDMDGAVGLTQKPVTPGETFPIRFTPPDPGTFTYRASAQPFAAEQVARGLSGVLIVEEASPPPVDDEVLLVLQDWRLDAEGAIGAPDQALRGEGRVGATITINAKPIPLSIKAAPGARLRLRLVNACAARLAGLILEGMADAQVIAIDGQPCGPFAPARHFVPAGPGARFDIVVDLPKAFGARAALVLRGAGLGAAAAAEPSRDLVVFTLEGAVGPDKGPIQGVAPNAALPAIVPLERAKRLDIVIAASAGADSRRIWTLNGVAGGPESKPLFSVARGQPVTLGFINKSEVAQAMHLHGHVMRVLHLLDDGWEPYWRDSVVIAPGKTARVAFIADNPGKWLIESGILERAAGGATGWFEVK